MNLSLAVNLLVACLTVPTALLTTFPTDDDCPEHGTQCLQPHECASDSKTTTAPRECKEGKVCCQRRFTAQVTMRVQEHVPVTSRDKFRYNPQRANNASRGLGLYLIPEKEKENSPLYTLSPNTRYSVNPRSEGNSGEARIVNVAVFNNTLVRPVVSYTKTSSSDVDQDDNFVFPENSEEDKDDRVDYFKKLYLKYIIDLKKYNAKKTGEDFPKRKLKYAIGYRSTKYCKLYEKYMVEDPLFAMPLLPSLFPVLMQKNHCSKPLPLIVGGVNASKGEFPHMAGLGYDRGEWIDFLCGGSLISERYVLTAAHCGHTKWGPPIIVRLGTRNLITDAGQNMDVEQVIVHPDYKEPSCYNDIALVKIAPGVQMGADLRPACLPHQTTQAGNPGSFLIATGWGRTGYGLFSSPNLQKVSLEVMNNKTCDQMFLGGRRSERLPSGIQSSMMCAAGYLDYSHDTCQGDSGGPLQTQTSHSKCMYEIIGITSFGKLCGTGLPAIYTRVSTFIPWIEEIVWPS